MNMIGIQTLTIRLASGQPLPSDDAEDDKYTIPANGEVSDWKKDRSVLSVIIAPHPI